jgi:hypothetical protein
MPQPCRDRLQPGDQIRLLVYRNCERPNQLRVQLCTSSNSAHLVFAVALVSGFLLLTT